MIIGGNEPVGCKVRWAPDATLALNEIERDGVGIVCSDIMMPGKMDGPARAKTICQKYRSCR